MKKIIVLLIFLLIVTFFATDITEQPLPVTKPLGTGLIVSKPVPYSDGRISTTRRLPSIDKGIIFKHGLAPNGSDIQSSRDIFVYKEKGIYYMTYDGAGIDRWSINEATSTDTVHWSRLGQILDRNTANPLESATVDYGTIYKTNDEYDMFYLGTPHQTAGLEHVPTPYFSTLKAHSSSPTGPWIKDTVTPLPLVAGSYYATTASPGTIIKQGNQYLMFFSAGNNANLTIGIARTTDLNASWVADSQPILPSHEQLENPSLYYQKANKTWYMFVNHVGVDAKGYQYTDAVWVYWTKDINHWTEQNRAVVVDGQSSSWSHTIIGLPSVVQTGNQLQIFYDGKSTGLDATNPSADHIGRDIGLATVQLPIRTQ